MMQITPRYRDLYRLAAAIRKESQSPRIKRQQQCRQACNVCLGVTDRATTEYVFVGLNPGGNGEERQLPPLEELTMADYVSQKYTYQTRVGEIIESFARHRNEDVSATVPRFGAANLSFYHGAMESGSFDIEVVECRRVLLAELDLPKLKALIFTGRECARFFYLLLWKPGSAVQALSDTNVSKLKEADPGAMVIKTEIGTGRKVACIFTRHLSPRGRPLPVDFTGSLGAGLSRLLAQ
jgi:hypothetical protein